MASSHGHPEYDANLLAATSAPTKGMLQSGYATDLLEDKLKPSRPDDLESGRHKSLSKHVSTNGTEPKVASTSSIPAKLNSSTEKKVAFYRTKKGIVVIVIVSIVILAAIIGGAVGGAKHKDSTLSNVQSLGNLSMSTTGSGSGGGQSGGGQSGGGQNGGGQAGGQDGATGNSPIAQTLISPEVKSPQTVSR